MNTVFRFICTALAIALAAVVFAPTTTRVASAQDDTAVVCDSTVATLLLVAEHDYHYISNMMMDEEAMLSMPHLDLGQFQPVIDGVMAMSGEMTEGEMSEEDQAMHDESLEMYMGMSSADMVTAYLEGMEMAAEGTTVLTPGDVAGEDAVCAQVRSDVESFLVAHILTEASGGM